MASSIAHPMGRTMRSTIRGLHHGTYTPRSTRRRFFYGVGYSMVYTMQYLHSCRDVMTFPGLDCPMSSPREHAISAPTANTSSGVSMEQPMAVSHERQRSQIPWHTPWGISFHAVCCGTCTMGSTTVYSMEFSVERPTGDLGIYHGISFRGIIYGRNVQAGIVGHRGIIYECTMVCSMIH